MQQKVEKIHMGLAALQEKRVSLVHLIHENVADSMAMQAPKFARISHEFNLLQSVLQEVIDECNSYFKEG